MIATWLRSLVPVVVIWLVAGPASAAVTSTFSAGVLMAASDAADAIAIGCTAPGGNVTVDGANPGTGAVACAVVTRIVVNGGPGANTLSLEAVTVSAYPGLATTSITGGLGDDTLIGSAIMIRDIHDFAAIRIRNPGHPRFFGRVLWLSRSAPCSYTGRTRLRPRRRPSRERFTGPSQPRPCRPFRRRQGRRCGLPRFS